MTVIYVFILFTVIIFKERVLSIGLKNYDYAFIIFYNFHTHVKL